MNIQSKLISLLSDGKFHSGEELGSLLKITRSAIWKVIKQLSTLGIEVNCVKGKGYQIPNGLDLLNKTTIYHHLSDITRKNIHCFEILEKVSSTNQYLLKELNSNNAKTSIVLTEYQSAGRGRRGRSWHSPYGKNIYLSLLWHFEKDPGELFGLSLVTAMAVIFTLEKYGLTNLQLKWPNDVLWNGRKLSGILIEMMARPHIETSVILGIGINVDMPKNSQINDWVDISEIISTKPDRNKITALLINEIVDILELFQKNGFSYFLPDWQRYDMLNNQTVTIYTNNNQFTARVLGISNKGELIILNEHDEIIHLLQGEVSVRLS